VPWFDRRRLQEPLRPGEASHGYGRRPRGHGLDGGHRRDCEDAPVRLVSLPGSIVRPARLFRSVQLAKLRCFEPLSMCGWIRDRRRSCRSPARSDSEDAANEANDDEHKPMIYKKLGFRLRWVRFEERTHRPGPGDGGGDRSAFRMIPGDMAGRLRGSWFWRVAAVRRVESRGSRI
jgi:hypothetical protein